MIDVLAVAIDAYALNIKELSETVPTSEVIERYLVGADEDLLAQLHPLVLSLPKVAHLLRLMILDHEELLEDRALAAAALNYFIMPFDAIPDTDAGIVGVLDDAYVMFALIQKMQSPSTALTTWMESQQLAIAMLQNIFPTWLNQYLEQWLGAVQLNHPTKSEE